MKVSFIYHSCFCVELDQVSLIFDYWRGKLPKLDPGKPVYVFASHSHYDHFNPEIFNLRQEYPDITFVLSDDISTEPAPDIVFVRPEESYTFKDVSVQTLLSNDIGVAFIVRGEDKTLMHFGDLNWWHWDDESDDFNIEKEASFKQAVGELAGTHIDIAFGPALDVRMEPYHWWGIDYFMRHSNVEKVIPMHFFSDYRVVPELLAMDEAQSYKERIVPVHRKNSEFFL